jgi:heterodisulfide reductase subunit C
MSETALSVTSACAELLDDLGLAGLDVQACYQCGRCSAGCPVGPFFDLLPMEVVRLAAYGQEDLLLKSQTIWLCASCETCSTRCPNGIDIAGLMDRLRQRALAAKVKPAEKGVAAFHRSFLRSVRRWGRTFEVGMLAAYKTRTGDLFSDMGLGWTMFRRGKLRLIPRGIRGKKNVKAMFKRSSKKPGESKGEPE